MKPYIKPFRIENRSRIRSLGVACAVAAAVLSPYRAGAVVFNESSQPGSDFSNNKAAPTALTLVSGDNVVIGAVGPSDSQDWVSITVPNGFQLSSLVLDAYPAANTGFTGFQSGSSFVGAENSDASAYLGYVHLDSSLAGTDLLPSMATAPGAQHFTRPVPAGTYTFLIQQLAAVSSPYEFDYVVTPVPEPRSQLAAAILLGAACLWKRRFARPAAAP